MDFGLGFLGEYITAAELVGKTPTLTIDKVMLEKVESLKVDDGGRGKVKDKIVVYFKESKGERGWLVNRTNALCLVEMWGRETNDWIGHKVTLFVQQVRVGPKMEPGIRVKGSPELTAPLSFELRLPRKKPIQTTLLPTGKASGKAKPDDAPTLSDYRALIADAAGDMSKTLVAADLRRSLSAEDQALLEEEERRETVE